MNILFALLSGVLLILGFPPFNLIFVAWFALVPLLVAVSRAKDIKQAFLAGFICGVVFFGGVLFWINILTEWVGIWAVIGFAALVIFEALFFGLFSSSVFYIRNKQFKFAIGLIPLLWVITEWLRSVGPFGVTGGGLGYSQVDFLVLAQTARMLGTYGLSFLIVFVNVFLFQLIGTKGRLLERLKAKKVELAVLLLLFFIVLSYGLFRLNQDFKFSKQLQISVIQAAIPQDVKLDSGQAWAIVDFHEILSRKALKDNPEIIIWPETAVITYLNLAPNIQSQMKKMIRESKAYYLIGASHTTGGKNYNSVVAFSPKGEIIGRYDKQKLVAFGEYLPLRFLIYPILKGIDLFAEDYHSNPAGNIIDLKVAKVGVIICFESTFPYLVRNKIKKGADFIVVVTNDAWFGDSPALAQHLQASRMRAIENGIYVVQAANTGISAIIDPAGRVIKRTEIDEEVILSGKVYF